MRTGYEGRFFLTSITFIETCVALNILVEPIKLFLHCANCKSHLYSSSSSTIILHNYTFYAWLSSPIPINWLHDKYIWILNQSSSIHWTRNLTKLIEFHWIFVFFKIIIFIDSTVYVIHPPTEWHANWITFRWGCYDNVCFRMKINKCRMLIKNTNPSRGNRISDSAWPTKNFKEHFIQLEF